MWCLILVFLRVTLLFSFFPLISSSTSEMDPHELETLFKIMETLSADQNWRESHPNPCKPGSSWNGIECKTTGNDGFIHVSRLDFGIPPNPSCKETAIFPAEIFLLPHLESVFFFQCFTNTKTVISFPEANQLLVNSSLQQLSIRSNPALVGLIPSQISSLKSLEILTLSQNKFHGPIPAQIFSLKSLLHLDFSYNMITGKIPFQVGNLGKLVGLDLSYNSLTGAIPNTIGQLGMLQKLDLSSNQLTGSIPIALFNLQSMVFIALSSNKIRGFFPVGLSKLQNLQYFIMDDNPMFTLLPSEFGDLEKLQELRLANSGYFGTIPSSYSKLSNLSTLSLQNNRLRGEIPVSFGNLSRIYHLNLSRNFLDGVVPFNSSFLSRLGKNLDLSGNPGLCLSPNDAHGFNLGVNICKSSKKSGLPWQKSEAHHHHHHQPHGLTSFFVTIIITLISVAWAHLFLHI
ncbi:OLC1v1023601C1 [Oldenlandia corymbosa var. corymbosa]|uniref:OLC1v1023601C1 n=2 Tax=Oldenlandia corymbosa var. corymbosa TaxID=529605 RepID=A0AAV1C344_OLDCO|nr:OLC1v1023601C1 [Oldenlandia corymbosa var. corymbosa]